MKNQFLSRKILSGKSYRDIARDLGTTLNYAHRLVRDPGSTKNVGKLCKLGAIIGMTESDARDEWARLRIAHLSDETAKRAKS